MHVSYNKYILNVYSFSNQKTISTQYQHTGLLQLTFLTSNPKFYIPSTLLAATMQWIQRNFKSLSNQGFLFPFSRCLGEKTFQIELKIQNATLFEISGFYLMYLQANQPIFICPNDCVKSLQQLGCITLFKTSRYQKKEKKV